MKKQSIALRAIRVDGGTQPRAFVDPEIVQEYADAMADGAAFPPVEVFDDGVSFWLADGFTRYHAATSLGLAEIEANVHEGSQRDAILFSCSANAEHGARRTVQDMTRAVMTLLSDEEWRKMADREIARTCKVSHPFVATVRSEMLGTNSNTGNGFQSRYYFHPKTGELTIMATGRSKAGAPNDEDAEQRRLIAGLEMARRSLLKLPEPDEVAHMARAFPLAEAERCHTWWGRFVAELRRVA